MKTTSAPPAARHPLLILLLLTSAFRLPPSAFSAAPDPLIPAALAPDRYKALAARSPFSPPTAEAPPPVVAPTPPPPGWGEKYTLGGLAQFGAGYKVTLNPKNPAGPANASAGGGNVSPTERIIVVTGAPSPDGITLAGVQWSDDPKQTRATLLKNGVPAVFTFDPSALSAAKGSAATAASIPAPRNSASAPAVPMMPNPGFTPPAPPPNGGMPPQPGIVRSPAPAARSARPRPRPARTASPSSPRPRRRPWPPSAPAACPPPPSPCRGMSRRMTMMIERRKASFARPQPRQGRQNCSPRRKPWVEREDQSPGRGVRAGAVDLGWPSALTPLPGLFIHFL